MAKTVNDIRRRIVRDRARLEKIAHEFWADESTLAEVISEEGEGAFAITPSGLAWRDTVVDPTAIADTRRELFVSIGTCSFREPIDDLVALGLLPVP